MIRLRSIIAISLLLLLTQCNKVPITGRNQFNLLSNSEMLTMSFSQYNQVISESQLSNDRAKVNMVKNCGTRISQAVEQYLSDEGLSDAVEGFEWEFNLIQSEQLNAWCMPGGKVAFYTGILDVCQDEAGVAVVMGHEVAHAIARHGNERMSQSLAAQMGGLALSAALQTEPEQTQQLALAAYGVGSQVGALLPFSRLHESEADEMGLYFMAMAGYNPEEAPEFWQRMSAMSGGAQPPEFLSTHPSHDTRVDNLNEWMPKAKTYYNPDHRGQGGSIKF
ncbi:MAG: M48 family metallopeptidase [Flavobacteriia bacterium]|nr:M48 family metallopeptidase [Flavobacteriia bacterium]